MAAPPSPRPPVMVLPFPAQGHVMPLMELSHRLVAHGLEVDFVNTHYNHDRALKAMAVERGAVDPDGMHMVSLPDGMGPDGDRTDIALLGSGLPAAMLGPLEEMIRSKKIKWVIADASMCWAMELAATAGVRVALFSTFSAAVFALRLHVPKLIDDGVLDESAFGSFTVFDAARIQELADGLELTGRPFLWAVRPNITAGIGEDWFDAFKRRVEGKGLVVGWAPQQRVLSHPAVACFVSHCGWNSTMEGMLHGVPFLCWPYFADQFANQSYICNVWGTGVKVHADERGVVTKEEIKNKVELLLGDDGIKARAATWKGAASASIAQGGSSDHNLLKLVKFLTQQ
uniref:Putative UDP-glucosyltransferase n=1 Tax=Aegilops tauschii TaxID=37682 RepID=N1QS52_AEGTA